MSEPLLVANAQGFWGDQPSAAAKIVEARPDLHFLTLDYLAELSMSILAIQREKDPSLGYARDFIDVVESIIPFWKEGSNVRIISNCGGLNPDGCAEAVVELLRRHAPLEKKIAIISGDSVLQSLRSPNGSSEFDHLENGRSITEVNDRLVTANAYIGAKTVAEAVRLDADIVICGRIADPSLTVGAAIANYGWELDAYDKIAGATVAGHLIECGAHVTGGFSTHWLDVPDPANIGFPIVEIEEDGSCVVTKPEGTGGYVNERTVKEQLLYEVGNPGKYLSPDITLSMLNLSVEELGDDRVRVSGAIGSKATDYYKVSATYRDGYRAEGMIVITGRDAPTKAKRCGEIVLERLKRVGLLPERTLIECLGKSDTAPGALPRPKWGETREVVLRICVADKRKEPLIRFGREIAPLVTSGPQGTTGYSSGRPRVRPVFGYWPCLIEKEKVIPQLQIREVR